MEREMAARARVRRGSHGRVLKFIVIQVLIVSPLFPQLGTSNCGQAHIGTTLSHFSEEIYRGYRDRESNGTKRKSPKP